MKRKTADITEILDEEEVSFARTLDRGEKLFEGYASRARESGQTELSGADVWMLYDTFGFPVDLTRLMAEELGLGINEVEFEAAQAKSKEASKASLRNGVKDSVKLDVHDIAALEANDQVPKTDDSPKFGKLPRVIADPNNRSYAVENSINATVKAIYHGRKFYDSTKEILELETPTTFGLLLDRTSFYAESGGQEYDTGVIALGDEAEFDVVNVQVFNGYVLHVGEMKYGTLQVGDTVVSSYDNVSSSNLE